jgi:hypothetical protein
MEFNPNFACMLQIAKYEGNVCHNICNSIQASLCFIVKETLLYLTEFNPNFTYTSESKKLSALLIFQFIYTKLGVEQIRHLST